MFLSPHSPFTEHATPRPFAACPVDDSLVDSVILQGAVEVEHHEIGVYENLPINANAMDREDVVAVLARNCESEQSALEKVKTLQAKVAAVTPKVAA